MPRTSETKVVKWNLSPVTSARWRWLAYLRKMIWEWRLEVLVRARWKDCFWHHPRDATPSSSSSSETCSNDEGILLKDEAAHLGLGEDADLGGEKITTFGQLKNIRAIYLKTDDPWSYAAVAAAMISKAWICELQTHNICTCPIYIYHSVSAIGCTKWK